MTSSATRASVRKKPGLDRSGSGEGRNGPVDRSEAGLGQVAIDLGEAAAAEEMARGERGGMGGGDDTMGFGRDEGELASSVVAPEEEHHAVGQVADRVDDGVGEGLPAFAAVAAGVSGGDGQDGVQQQHALMGPRFEAAVIRTWQPEIRAEFLVDVPQGPGDRPDLGSDREAEAVGVTGRGVGILTEEHDADEVGRGEFEGAENLVGLGQDLIAAGEGIVEETVEGRERGLPGFGGEQRFPGGWEGRDHAWDQAVASSGSPSAGAGSSPLSAGDSEAVSLQAPAKRAVNRPELRRVFRKKVQVSG